jgi:hypothetical protein
VKTYSRRGISIIAILALTLGLAGCGTLTFAVFGQVSETPLYQKGQVADILGRVEVDKHQITIVDQSSSALFRLVGLRSDEQKSLANLAGEIVRLRLKVISTESAHAFRAQLVQYPDRK